METGFPEIGEDGLFEMPEEGVILKPDKGGFFEVVSEGLPEGVPVEGGPEKPSWEGPGVYAGGA